MALAPKATMTKNCPKCGLPVTVRRTGVRESATALYDRLEARVQECIASHVVVRRTAVSP